MANIKPLKQLVGKIVEIGVTDTILTNNLGTGVANGLSFLRGDQIWVDPNTMSQPCGELYMVSNVVPTVITTINTYTKVLGTTTSGIIQSFNMSANNRLVYTGVPTIMFKVTSKNTIQFSGNN